MGKCMQNLKRNKTNLNPYQRYRKKQKAKSVKCLVLLIQLQPRVHRPPQCVQHPPQDPMEITRVQTLYPKIKIIRESRSNTYPKTDRYCKMIPMTQMNRTLIEKILTVCRSPISRKKKNLKTNYESSSKK